MRLLHTHSSRPETTGDEYMRRHLALGHDLDVPDCVDLSDLVIEHVKHHDGAVTMAEERLADVR